MRRGAPRFCVLCGTQLARDNNASSCAMCARVHDESPRFPAKVWRTDIMRAALAKKDMGSVVYAYRHLPVHGRRPIPQEVVARWLHISQGQLSRIERGRNHARDIDQLAHYARTLRIPPSLLWFEVDDAGSPRPVVSSTDQVVLPSGKRVPAAVVPTALPLAEAQLLALEQYARMDMLAGPHSLLPVVAHQIAFIDQLRAGSRGRTRNELLYVSARYAEFMGWLEQDAGDLSAAMSWSNKAYDMVKESGDRCFISYIFMRKSNIATDAGKPALAVSFANDALADSGALTPRLRAVALRQKANGDAAVGDLQACSDALNQALEEAAAGEETADLAGYCTPEFISMEASNCYVQLGHPELALTTLQDVLAGWQPDSRRDLGLGMARLATAYAGTGQPDEALQVSQHALTIVADTRSSRTAGQLRRLSTQLTASGAFDHAQELDRLLKMVLRRSAKPDEY